MDVINLFGRIACAGSQPGGDALAALT